MELRNDLVLRHVGEDHVIVDPSQDMVDMSTVFSLNDSAAWLWKELEGRKFTSETMVDLLKQQYDVTDEQAEMDVVKLIDIFEKHDLLK